MTVNTKYRTDKPEIMDDFAMQGAILRDALDKIAGINSLLGGNRLTLNGVKQLIRNLSQTKEIVIVDVGCGNGDMLRTLAEFASKNQLKFKLIGIDANQDAISYAQELSQNYPNISYFSADVFDASFKEVNCDIGLITLTLHHFKNEEIVQLLRVFYANTRMGIVINDLHRNAVAYRLFQVLCFVFRLNDMSREDGLISILRGFKKAELIDFSKKLNFKKYTIHWKWAFRYQWIISKL